MTPFEQAVLDDVDQIPRGSVSTYSEVAARAGRPRAPRSVGGTLAKFGVEVPWHRVLRADGSVPQGARQVQLLTSENVQVSAAGRVDLRRYLWDGPVA